MFRINFSGATRLMLVTIVNSHYSVELMDHARRYDAKSSQTVHFVFNSTILSEAPDERLRPVVNCLRLVFIVLELEVIIRSVQTVDGKCTNKCEMVVFNG